MEALNLIGTRCYFVAVFEFCAAEGGLTFFGNGILIVARGIALS